MQILRHRRQSIVEKAKCELAYDSRGMLLIQGHLHEEVVLGGHLNNVRPKVARNIRHDGPESAPHQQAEYNIATLLRVQFCNIAGIRKR
jgi:hypothetical protein